MFYLYDFFRLLFAGTGIFFIFSFLFNTKDEDLIKILKEDIKPIEKKVEEKFEEKFLKKFREMPNQYFFTKEEEDLILSSSLFQQIQNNETLERNKRISFLQNNVSEQNKNELDEILKNPITNNFIQEKVLNHVIQLKLKKLKNSNVIVMTPLGNVVMTYDVEKNAFEYYSDNTIPYRYLEPVGRKFALTFQCKPIFVDMEEQLKEGEKKLLEKEQKEKEEKEKQKLNKNENKKNVFAKFKNYNKDAKGHVVASVPPKNSIPNLKPIQQLNEKAVLKEKANMYSYMGRFSNFQILQKIDRKKIDKKFAMTFSDFKKLKKN